MKTLVVDDLYMMRKLISNSVKSINNSEIIEAADGVSALEQLSAQGVDLIITDWLMPNMDGLQMVKKLRSLEDFKKIPILMISCVHEKENICAALRAGISDYLIKPFTGHALKIKLDSLMPSDDSITVKV